MPQAASADNLQTVLVDYLNQRNDIAVALLYGSRARQKYTEGSDWDIALLFDAEADQQDRMARLVLLKNALERDVLKGFQVDCIDLAAAPLGLCISIADEGQVLKGEAHLGLFHFYQRAWRGREEFHFRKQHGL